MQKYSHIAEMSLGYEKKFMRLELIQRPIRHKSFKKNKIKNIFSVYRVLIQRPIRHKGVKQHCGPFSGLNRQYV